MIKNLFILAAALTVFSANAQVSMKVTKVKQAGTAKIAVPNQVASSIDTLYPASLDPSLGGCGTQPGGSSYYQFDNDNIIDTGYCFGTNAQPFLLSGVTYTIVLSESAQKYNVTGSASITGILFGAAVAHSNAGTTMVTGNIYSMDNTTKGPSSTVLGTSTGLPLNTVSTMNFNTLSFGSPVNVSNQNFFASVVAPPFANGDSLAIISTAFGCSSTDSLSWSRETAVAPGGTQVLNKWYSVKYLIGGGSQNLDLWQFPILNITTATSSVSRGDLSLFAATPNPAVNSINLNFSLNSASAVQIEIYDLTGKVVKAIKNADVLSTGKHAISLDVTNLEAGSYMYSITAAGSRMVSKFIVAK